MGMKLLTWDRGHEVLQQPWGHWKDCFEPHRHMAKKCRLSLEKEFLPFLPSGKEASSESPQWDISALEQKGPT